MKSIISKLLIIISMIIVIILLVYLNTLSYKEKITIKTTTTKAITQDINNDYIENDNLLINGHEEKISVKEYKDYYLGIVFKFEYNNFVINKLSNNSLIIINNNDENEYLKMEKLEELEYYQNYEKYNDVESQEDIYTINYKFLTGNSAFFKITKKYNNENDIKYHLDYIINSLYFN